MRQKTGLCCKRVYRDRDVRCWVKAGHLGPCRNEQAARMIAPETGGHAIIPEGGVRIKLHRGQELHVEPRADDSVSRDMVNHPSHYGGEDATHEHVKCAEAWGLQGDAHLYNATKYIARAGKKDPAKKVEDLRKAAWYLARAIRRAEGFI